MLMMDWPPGAKEAIRESVIMRREAEKIPYELRREDNNFLRRELADRYYSLNLQANFEVGKGIAILKESIEDTNLSYAYREGLEKDLKWLGEIYSENAGMLKKLFDFIKSENLTNTPKG